jgi:hypothetical protein
VVIPLEALKVVVAATLVTLGGYRSVEQSASTHSWHAGRLSRSLTVWSFPMASAHGAGSWCCRSCSDVDATVSAQAAAEHAHLRSRGVHRVEQTRGVDAMAVGNPLASTRNLLVSLPRLDSRGRTTVKVGLAVLQHCLVQLGLAVGGCPRSSPASSVLSDLDP